MLFNTFEFKEINALAMQGDALPLSLITAAWDREPWKPASRKPAKLGNLLQLGIAGPSTAWRWGWMLPCSSSWTT